MLIHKFELKFTKNLVEVIFGFKFESIPVNRLQDVVDLAEEYFITYLSSFFLENNRPKSQIRFKTLIQTGDLGIIHKFPDLATDFEEAKSNFLSHIKSNY